MDLNHSNLSFRALNCRLNRLSIILSMNSSAHYVSTWVYCIGSHFQVLLPMFGIEHLELSIVDRLTQLYKKLRLSMFCIAVIRSSPFVICRPEHWTAAHFCFVVRYDSYRNSPPRGGGVPIWIYMVEFIREAIGLSNKFITQLYFYMSSVQWVPKGSLILW